MLMLQRDQAWRGLQTGGCERKRLTLFINNTNFPLINMQQLKHIIFQNLLNEPRTIIITKLAGLFTLWIDMEKPTHTTPIAERSTNAADAVHAIRMARVSVSMCRHEWDYLYSWIKNAKEKPTNSHLFINEQSIVYIITLSLKTNLLHKGIKAFTLAWLWYFSWNW